MLQMDLTELKKATNSAIRKALTEANIPTLLVVLAHLEKDLSLLTGDGLPSSSIDGVSNMSPSRQREIRDHAFRVLCELRDEKRSIPPLPDTDTLRKMASVYVNQQVAEEYIPMMLSDMGFDGTTLEKIKWQKEPPKECRDEFKVAIIGAGISGLCAAVHLQRAGIPFVIIEKNPTVGGTWYENTYPDCGVDTPNHFYSFSFEPNFNWSRFYSKRDEIFAYLERFTDKYDLRRHIRFETEVLRAEYDEGEKSWRLSIRDKNGHEENLQTNALVSAVGQLNRPKIPDFPGKDTFERPAFHSAEWESQHDLKGKKVAVIGTGASAMQFAPAIAPLVEELIIFQRSPHWIRMLPDYHREVSESKGWLLRNIPYYRNWYRFKLFWSYGDGIWDSLHKDPEWPHSDRSLNSENEYHRQIYIRNLRKALNDDADLMAKVIPDYPPFAKRMLIDNHWCEMLKRDNVTLLTSGVQRIERNGVVDDDGALNEVDVIIYATGFHAHDFLAPMEIHGRDGKTLSKAWRDDPKAYLGITTPGFPNMFMLYGPNTNLAHGGSTIFHAECQARYIMQCLMHLIETNSREVEVREEINADYNDRVDAEHNSMVWTHPDVGNWYKNSRGRVVSNSPWRLVDYWSMTRQPNFDDFVWAGNKNG